MHVSKWLLWFSESFFLLFIMLLCFSMLLSGCYGVPSGIMYFVFGCHGALSVFNRLLCGCHGVLSVFSICYAVAMVFWVFF